uniref:Uncharacterized protein n=1 Tax=Aegilops tauschii subsp. strangulata TaxID=200361 RepID=A0A453GG11_AEGTS
VQGDLLLPDPNQGIKFWCVPSALAKRVLWPRRPSCQKISPTAVAMDKTDTKPLSETKRSSKTIRGEATRFRKLRPNNQPLPSSKQPQRSAEPKQTITAVTPNKAEHRAKGRHRIGMILVAVMAELLEEYTAAVARALERLL